MKKRLVALTASAVAIATLGLAAPAHAGGYVRQGVYNWGDQCLGIGYYGLQNHTWSAYYCETQTPSSPSGPGSYILYVVY